jgi:hypothetical protein
MKGNTMAVDSMVQRLLNERDGKLTLIDQIAGVADDAGRDLYETESQTIKEAQERVRSLNTQIDSLTQNLELAEGARSRIRSLDPSIIAADFQYRSPGEYMWDIIHRGDDPDAGLRLNKFHARAAEHMGFDKSKTVAVAGGFNGLTSVPVLGTVLDPYPSSRPLFTALGPRTITSLEFRRPRIVDPNFSTGVGPVAQEKLEMPSKAWDILSDTLIAERVGGYINVSGVLEEMVAGSLDMIVTHMNKRVAALSEARVVAELGETGASVPLAADATSSDILSAIGQAVTLVVQATQQLPQWIAMGAEAWGRLIGTSDLAGRPILPPVGPVNALGTGDAGSYSASIAGLRAIVTPAITDASMYVGNNYGLEVYERPMPLMQVLEPSVYGRQVGVATFLAFYHPPTAEAGPSNTPPAEYNSIVKIAWA